MYGTYFDKDGYHISNNAFFNRCDAFAYLTSGKDFRAFGKKEANDELNQMETDYNNPDDIISLFRQAGPENVRIFAQMRQFSSVIPGMGIALCDADKRNWVECRIDEKRYKLHEGYKITLVPVDPYDRYYASEHYYQSDFRSLYSDGYFILKTKENQHVELVKWTEEIPGSSAYFAHEAFLVV